ncbi:MAG TPA: efflux RND transporter periplasmic adaptor subunit, partial [Candidatus Berkiella sp.]|nr:efflux RND transporter periplasmic adaptor subunit [Candidatus Berkiella sp.]
KWLMGLALLAISKMICAVDAQKMSLPGEIVLNENKVTHVVAAVQGHVKDIYKNLGEPVEKGERLVSFQSREMAEIKAAYLAAYQEIQLKNEILKREEKLCKAHVKAEIEFAKTKIGVETAKIHLEQAKQKLLALGVG